VTMRWLAECSAEALGEALRVVAPDLSGFPVTVPAPDPVAQRDPLWWSAGTVVGGRFIAKFAWSRPAALRLVRESWISRHDASATVVRGPCGWWTGVRRAQRRPAGPAPVSDPAQLPAPAMRLNPLARNRGRRSRSSRRWRVTGSSWRTW
jgi:hypothetical protein